MRLLVTGGRGYAGDAAEALDAFHARFRVRVLIHGGAAGLDSLADAWAQGLWERGWRLEVLVFPVTRGDWAGHGRAAGPMRNAKMLRVGQPDCVLAFPGERGTASMVAMAARAGVNLLFAEDIVFWR